MAEQTPEPRFIVRTGHPFPLPRAWPAIVGAADGPISCALIFLWERHHAVMPHRRLGISVLETYQAQRAQNVDGRDKFTAGPATSGRTRLPGHDATEE